MMLTNISAFMIIGFRSASISVICLYMCGTSVSLAPMFTQDSLFVFSALADHTVRSPSIPYTSDEGVLEDPEPLLVNVM